MYATLINSASAIEGTTSRIQVAAARMSLAKCPVGRDHARELDAALQALDALWNVVTGQPQPQARFIGDDIEEDFEDSDDPSAWPVWCDDSIWTTEAVPVRILALSLPPISGGSPEADFAPSPEDEADYRLWCESVDRTFDAEWMDRMAEIADGYELEPDHFTEADARAAGLAV